MFEGRRLLIATKHSKEKVIAPILERELGVICSVVANFDTDQLGTFTGEIERTENPVVTARQKCMQAMELENYDLCIASEGFFGPHPTLHFVPADDEWLILIDKKNNLEILVRELSAETNFSGSIINSEKELKAFIEQVKFPSHALIMRKGKDDTSDVVKGITNIQYLERTFNTFLLKYGKAYIETDMRAMFNPTRMKVIEQATIKLVDKLKAFCPNCQTPGFGITDVIEGLPCAWCNTPTRSILMYVYTCQKCKYKKEEKYPKGKQFEDPMHCNMCNP